MTANSPLASLSGRFRGWFESRLNERWYGDRAPLWVARPLAALYGYLADRRKQQQLTRAASTSTAVPTIVVGNIVAGGTGKTPVVAHLVSTLMDAGFTPGIVTRGYGGRSRVWPRVVTPDSDPHLCGDEAVELAALTGVPVVAAPDRTAAARWLRTYFGCSVVVSDDGLQHYALQRGLEIALVDATRRFGNGQRLPAGPLREPVERLAEVDAVLITGRSPAELAPAKEAVIQELLAWPNVPALPQTFCCALQPASFAPLMGGDIRSVDEAPFTNASVVALSGIANPRRFHLDLEGLGCTVTPLALADHHNYDLHQLDALLKETQGDILTTGKDAAKLRRLVERGVVQGVLNEESEDIWWKRTWVLQRTVEVLPSEGKRLQDVVIRYCEAAHAPRASASEAQSQ